MELRPSEAHPFMIKDLLGHAILPFDIFVKAGGKFLLVGRRGADTPREQLSNYQKKKVQSVYVRTEDYTYYMHRAERKLDAVIKDKNVPNEAKVTVLGHMAKRIFDNLKGLGFSREVFSFAKKVIDKSITVIEGDLNLKQLMDSLQKSGDEFVAHSMAVGGVAVMIAKAEGWTLRENFETLALGSMLHDIGLKLIPEEILKKPIADLTPEELEIYQTHPELGFQLLKSIQNIPQEILAIAYEHHEKKGIGYPRGLRETNIQPFARLVSLADHFCELTIRSKNHPNPISPQEAIQLLLKKDALNYRAEDITGLSRAILKK